MAISLSSADYWELNRQISPPPEFVGAASRNENRSLNPAESFYAVPSLNQGYAYYLELGADIELSLWQETYFEDTEILCATRSHPWIELTVLLKGSYQLDTGMALKAGQSHLQGSGIAAGDRELYRKNKFCHCLNVHLDPAILSNFFSRATEPLPAFIQELITDNEWQTVLSPQRVTPEMAAVTRQILNCPFQGFTQQMYLQSKIWELLALQLAVFLPESRSPSYPLKPQTIERIHAAKDILLARLEQPPTIPELARQVGVSERTLQRGFQSLFGMTVFAYLTDRRMLQADLWLRASRSVADVANLVGYSNPGHFAAAFKRRFGITPTAYSLGKKFG